MLHSGFDTYTSVLRSLIGGGALFMLLLPTNASAEAGINSSGSFSTRFDSRDGKEDRYQYRLRWYLDTTLSDQLSLHGFVVTGDEFSSSHNTFGESDDQSLHLRRLFLRHSMESLRFELGYIPPYKGRVSSTGLAKDGWIAGARLVSTQASGDNIELVVGELQANNEPGIGGLEKIDYGELEYSTASRGGFSFELGLERLLESTFTRTELRYQPENAPEFTLEWVNNVTRSTQKWMFSIAKEGSLFGKSYDFLAFYSDVPEQFGGREELTEDFTQFGESLTAELKLEWVSQLAVVSKVEHGEKTNRYQIGLEYKF